jgi:hypothetical protein
MYTWLHVLRTQSGCSQQKLQYINGVLDITLSSSSGTGTGPFWFGGAKSTAEYFQGRISDVRLYDFYFDATDAQRLAAETRPDYCLSTSYCAAAAKDSTCTYTCSAGQTSASPATCTAGGTAFSSGAWDPEPLCTDILCSEDEYVSNNMCVSCLPGSVNGAGDDASGSDTFCSVILCGMDEYVLDHACVPCAEGTTNTAGDDATGVDTSCQVVDCQVPLQEGYVFTSGATVYSSTLDATCAFGYAGQPSLIICQDTGLWSPSSGCELVDCGEPVELGYIIEPGATVYGTIRNTSCDLGFSGSVQASECQATGTWTFDDECLDDDECLLGVCHSSHGCVNTLGSFVCLPTIFAINTTNLSSTLGGNAIEFSIHIIDELFLAASSFSYGHDLDQFQFTQVSPDLLNNIDSNTTVVAITGPGYGSGLKIFVPWTLPVGVVASEGYSASGYVQSNQTFRYPSPVIREQTLRLNNSDLLVDGNHS